MPLKTIGRLEMKLLMDVTDLGCIIPPSLAFFLIQFGMLSLALRSINSFRITQELPAPIRVKVYELPAHTI